MNKLMVVFSLSFIATEGVNILNPFGLIKKQPSGIFSPEGC